MNIPSRIAATAALVCLVSSIALAQAPVAAGNDGLVPVKSRNVDKAWLLPGADFRPYKKVLLKSAEVAFQKDWLRDNSTRTGSRIPTASQADALKIVEAARAGFDEIWAKAFSSAGYQVVTTPGEDVLQVSPRVVDLYINAPSMPTAGIGRTYTMEAGEATLQLEVRDSRTGTLLGRASDRRLTTKGVQAQLTDAVTNRAEFAKLFATWAVIAAKGLEDLKAASPLPEKLRAGEKVPPR